MNRIFKTRKLKMTDKRFSEGCALIRDIKQFGRLRHEEIYAMGIRKYAEMFQNLMGGQKDEQNFSR